MTLRIEGILADDTFVERESSASLAQDDNSASGAGAVYVFSNDSNEWRQRAYLKAASPDMDETA